MYRGRQALGQCAGKLFGGRCARGAIRSGQGVTLAENDVDQADVVANDQFIGSVGYDRLDLGAVFF